MSDIQKYLKEQLKNDNFKKEWDKLQPEFYVIDALIEARKSSFSSLLDIDKLIQF